MFTSIFINGGFETGTASGWTVGGGSRTSVGSNAVQPSSFLPGGPLYNAQIASGHSAIVTSGQDPNLGALMPNIVYSGTYSWRVEDLTIGGYASVITQEVNAFICTEIYFAWLAVLENGGHSADDSAVMVITLTDTTTNEELISRHYDAGGSGVDARFNSTSSGYFYTPQWQIEHLTIPYTRVGHNFRLTVAAMDCRPTGHRGYVYLDAFGGSMPVQNP